MNNKSKQDIWFTTTAKGTKRAWYYSLRQMRAFPMPLAEAELLIATEQACLIAKPEWVGR